MMRSVCVRIGRAGSLRRAQSGAARTVTKPLIVTAAQNVGDAMQLMSDHDSGCVLVEEDGFLTGLLNERSVIVGARWYHTPASDVAVAPIQTVAQTATAAEALYVMNEHCMRDIPVVAPGVKGGQSRYRTGDVVGMLALNEVLASYMTEHASRLATLISETAEFSPRTGERLSCETAHLDLELGSLDWPWLPTHSDFYTTPKQTVREALSTMKRFDKGALPVLEGGVLCGVLSERDLVCKVGALGLDPREVRVDDVMCAISDFGPAQLTAKSTVQQAIVVMAQTRQRHLPLATDEGGPFLLSMRDISRHLAKAHEAQIKLAISAGGLDFSGFKVKFDF